MSEADTWKAVTIRKDIEKIDGAEGEIRTRTGLPPLDPEPSVSTSSTTSALEIRSNK